MKQSERPLWKKSMLEMLDYDRIRDMLEEISENGDMYGYASDESGYYQEYKEQFDELAAGAYSLWERLCETDVTEYWDDMTVALLGKTTEVLGYDSVETDYYHMTGDQEDFAVEEAEKRLERYTKPDLIKRFRKVLTILMCFADIKAAHDCLTSIVQELDEQGALLERKNAVIDQLYGDLTGKDGETFDAIVERLPQRMWVE